MIFLTYFSEVLHQDQECQDHEVIEEEEAQDEEDVPSLNRTVSANSSSFAHIEYANRGRRMQRTKSGAQYVRRRQEKSTAIIVAIIVVFFVCHVFRLSFRIYEMALPESSVYDHYKHCDSQGKYHVPVIIYFLTHIHTLFLDINSSINFGIDHLISLHSTIIVLGFPTGRDFLVPWDKGTDITSLSRDNRTTGQAQNLATGWDGTVCQNPGLDTGRASILTGCPSP